MPNSHITKLYGIRDAKIDAVLTDPSGGPATFGTALDIPGIKSITFTQPYEIKRLRGDNGPLDAFSVIGDPSGTFEGAKLSLDVLQLLTSSAAVADSGSAPNQLTNWNLKSTDIPGFFRIRGQAAGTDVGIGEARFTIWKSILSGDLPLGLAEEDFKLVDINFGTVPLVANSKIIDIDLAQTFTALT